MESNRERIEAALARVRQAVEKAMEATEGGSVYDGALETVNRLTGETAASGIAREAHTELLDHLMENTRLCGYAEAEVVAVVNGLKDLIEGVDGWWYFEDGRWQHQPNVKDLRRALAPKGAGVTQ